MNPKLRGRGQGWKQSFGSHWHVCRNGNHDRGCHYSGSMWSEKKSGWRTEPCEMAAVAEQMEEDKPTKGPEKEPSKVQGDPENVVSWKLQEGRDD